MKKKILIHSIAFSPDGVSTAYLYNDIALKFVAEGYEVVVLTTTPHYNRVQEELDKQPLKAKLGGLYYKSYFNGISVLHVPQKKFKSALLRIVGFLYWHSLSLILGICQKNISLILSPSPPLTIGLINIIVGKLKGAKVIYNVQEIYPDFLINQGSLKTKWVIRLLKSLEKFVYAHSSAVTTIDSIFYETIVDRFRDSSNLHIIPNFVDTTLFRPDADNGSLNAVLFPKKDGILKIMYAGNIGHAQDWGPLIEVAKCVGHLPVEFWVIGEGVMKNRLSQEIKINDLKNIHLIAYQPRDLMPQLISYADIHFIFMAPEMEGQGFPSKVYTIMACAKPLLVVSGMNTPIRNFLESLKCSFIVDSRKSENKCQAIVQFITDAVADKSFLSEMGKNGYKIVQEQYSNKAVTDKYVDLANKILNDEH